MDLGKIDTIFILLMENRSFDHILGYLSLPPASRDIEGIRQAWAANYACAGPSGHKIAPWHYTGFDLPVDPPHERLDMRVQMGAAQANAPMDGFVLSYSSDSRVRVADYPQVMAYYGAAEVPITDFLASNFVVCDRYFSALPTSTQPNRLMAMSGYTMRDYTKGDPFDDQHMVYDWLQEHGRAWRVYYQNFPFFMLMERIAKNFLEDTAERRLFRSFDSLKNDVLHEAKFPEVVFIEPRYTDAPHVEPPNDDHPITAVTAGQRFLWRVYEAVTANPDRWKRSMLIVTYDENGGFFDHVPPPACDTPQNHGETYRRFVTTGIRVPALVISPWVAAGSQYHGVLDHLSILRLLAAKFTPGQEYSADVSGRTAGGSLADIPDLPQVRDNLPDPPSYATPGNGAATEHTDEFGLMRPNALAFRNALEHVRDLDSEKAVQRFPHLDHFFRPR